MAAKRNRQTWTTRWLGSNGALDMALSWSGRAIVVRGTGCVQCAGCRQGGPPWSLARRRCRRRRVIGRVPCPQRTPDREGDHGEEDDGPDAERAAAKRVRRERAYPEHDQR